MEFIDLNDTQILTLAQAAGVPITESDAIEIKHQINAIIQMIEPIDVRKNPPVDPLPLDLAEYTNHDKTSDPDSKPSSRVGSTCLLYTSPSPRDATLSRMPSSA